MSIDITARVHVDREPAAIGSRVRRVAYFLRRRVEYVNEILREVYHGPAS